MYKTVQWAFCHWLFQNILHLNTRVCLVFIDYHLCWLTLCLEIPWRSGVVFLCWSDEDVQIPCAPDVANPRMPDCGILCSPDVESSCGRVGGIPWVEILYWYDGVYPCGSDITNSYIVPTGISCLLISEGGLSWSRSFLIQLQQHKHAKLSSLTIFFCGTSMQSPSARNTCKV